MQPAQDNIAQTAQRLPACAETTSEIGDYLRGQHKAPKIPFLDIKPFPHLVIDNFLPVKLCEKIEQFGRTLASLDDNSHLNSKKKANNRYWEFPTDIRDLLSYFYSSDFEQYLSEVTGIDGIQADYKYNWGGGYHVLPYDGFLNVHKDFNIHPHTKTHRRLNVIIYLNHDWADSDGGQLELWDMERKERFANIVPLFNRCVIFETSEISYHGNPQRVTKRGLDRMSYSLYYYTDDRPDAESISSHTTVYVDRPGEYKNFIRTATRPIAQLVPETLRAKIRDALFK